MKFTIEFEKNSIADIQLLNDGIIVEHKQNKESLKQWASLVLPREITEIRENHHW